jgi:hypothetical protein
MRPATCRRSCGCAGWWAEVEARAAGWARTVAYLGAWLSCTALILVTMAILRGAALDLATYLAASTGASGAQAMKLGWQIEFVDRFGLLVLAVLGAGAAFGTEYYFRYGARSGQLGRRVVRVGGATLAVALIGVLVQLVL